MMQVFISHRCCDPSMPENTLESMKRMHEKGANWFEIDCFLLADGGIAVIHDKHLKRTTGQKGTVTKMTTEEIKKVVVIGGNGNERIRLLPEFMDYAVEHNVKISIELKGRNVHLATKVDNLISRYDSEHFTVYSFNKTFIDIIADKHPSYPVHWSMKKLSGKRLKEAARLGVSINLDGRYVKQSDIEKIKAEDLAVHVYTVNDKALANDLFSFGVDAVITDTLIVGK